METGMPFVYLLHTINGKYVYDVNRNDIILVDEDVYHALRKMTTEEAVIIEPYTQKKLARLNEMGYLSTHRVREIKHPATDYLEEYLDRKVSKITLQVTQGCNLRCSYCIYSDLNNEKQRTHSSKRMNLETARKAVDFLAEHSIDNEEVNISFYGGEPLLEIELIQNVISYSKLVFEGKKVTYNLTSNATLLSDEIIEYFMKENVRVMVSIDGPEEIHDQNRRYAVDGSGTFHTVMRNLNYIKEKYPEFLKQVDINMVIDPQNQFDHINSVFKDYDVFSKIDIRSAIIDDIYSFEKTTYSDDYSTKMQYQFFLGYLNQYGRISSESLIPMVIEERERIKLIRDSLDRTESLSDCTAPGGPCIPGQQRLFVDVEGTFFPCERVNEKSDCMNIGNLEEGFYYEKAEKLLNIGHLTKDECRNCWAFRHCNICAKYTDDVGTLSKDLKLSQCENVRSSLRETLLDIIMQREVEDIYLNH